MFTINQRFSALRLGWRDGRVSECLRSVSQFLKRVISSVRRFISLCKSETINLIKSRAHKPSIFTFKAFRCFVIPTHHPTFMQQIKAPISNAFTSTPPQNTKFPCNIPWWSSHYYVHNMHARPSLMSFSIKTM